MDSIGGLLLDGRIPPPIEVENVVRGREVQASAAGSQGDDQDLRAAGARERFQQLRPLAAVEVAVEKRRLFADALLQMRNQRREPRVLREDERLVALRDGAE